jgi:hypothetical protein
LPHNARKSLTKLRVQLLGDLDALVHAVPEKLRSQPAGPRALKKHWDLEQ